MPFGYRVTPNTGDTIYLNSDAVSATRVEYTRTVRLGEIDSGQVTVSGTPISGTFWQDVNGLTYFEPTSGTLPGAGTVANYTIADYASRYDAAPGGVQDNVTNGTTGSDAVYGGTSSASQTGTGNDALYGGDAGDFVFGGDGNDSVFGGAGADVVHGGIGNDTVRGGTGNDSLYGGDGIDTLDYSGRTAGMNINLTTARATTGTTETDTVRYFEAVSGTEGDDTITGATGAETLLGNGGNDAISGADGADSLVGGAGNDTLSGGAGSDTLVGGEGTDSLTGGAGADTFTIDGTTPDTITDFDATTGIGDDTVANDFVNLVDFYNEAELAEYNAANPTNTYANAIGWMRGDLADDGILQGAGGTVLQGVAAENLNEENTGVLCFTPGTMIRTLGGQRPIESLKVGDMVLTRDGGLQPIRWIGNTTVQGTGTFAPIRLRKGAVPDLTADLVVSPQHRMLVEGYRAEVMFGEREVLASAKHMVDDKYVTVEETDAVTYIHMLFDRHEVVYANGAATESYHPAAYGMDSISEKAREELFAFFPELRSMPESYGRTARRALKGFEARALTW